MPSPKGSCSRCGASNTAGAKLCASCHRQGLRSARIALDEEGRRTCPSCGTKKELSEFPLKGHHRHGDRRYGYCKPCHSKYQRQQTLARSFGLTEADYNQVVTYQDGSCAICKRPPKNKKLSVDHDHKTGLIRGALCWGCNKTLGLWREDVKRFQTAIDYLQNPPAPRALGREVFGRTGSVKRKRRKSTPKARAA